MSFKPNPMQVLFLLNLVFKGGKSRMSEIKPKLSPVSFRKQLIENGLIKEEKQKRIIFTTVTEKGWDWADNNLDAEFSTGSNASKFALMELLPKLKNFMQKNSIFLAEILCDAGASGKKTLKTKLPKTELPVENYDTTTLEEKIKQAYFKVAKSQWNIRVRLYTLRKELVNIERSLLDKTLLQMQSDEKLLLYSMDDIYNIKPEDTDAAIHIGEFARHILYMEK